MGEEYKKVGVILRRPTMADFHLPNVSAAHGRFSKKVDLT